jgi:hypothetical protein
MPEPQDSHEARNEALGAVRPLVASEETRSTNLNTRALGVISASSVITALAGLFAKEVFSSAALQKLGDSKVPAFILLIASLVLLVSTVMCGVWTLWPRHRGFIKPDGLANWEKRTDQAPLNEVLIRQQTLADQATELGSLRLFNEGKVRRLTMTYGLYAFAVLTIAVDAGLFFVGSV